MPLHLTAPAAMWDEGANAEGAAVMKRLLVAAAMLLAAGSAGATTLTFDELADGYYAQTIVSQGFQFDDFQANSPIALFTWGAGSDYDADPAGRTLNNNYFRSTITLTKVGGGAFDFNSVDLTDIYNNFEGQPGGDVLFSFFDGANTTTQTVTIDGTPGFQTFTFNRTGLVSLTFQAVTTNEVQADNFVLNAAAGVPEPAGWTLMLGGFGLMGGALRRRRAGLAA
jgi:hypothetical protein